MSTSTYAISKWPDTGEIYENLKTLINQPIRPIPQDTMNE